MKLIDWNHAIKGWKVLMPKFILFLKTTIWALKPWIKYSEKSGKLCLRGKKWQVVPKRQKGALEPRNKILWENWQFDLCLKRPQEKYTGQDIMTVEIKFLTRDKRQMYLLSYFIFVSSKRYASKIKAQEKDTERL